LHDFKGIEDQAQKEFPLSVEPSPLRVHETTGIISYNLVFRGFYNKAFIVAMPLSIGANMKLMAANAISHKRRLQKLYQNMEADIDKELTADLVGDYIFSDIVFPDYFVLLWQHRLKLAKRRILWE